MINFRLIEVIEAVLQEALAKMRIRLQKPSDMRTLDKTHHTRTQHFRRISMR